MGPKKIVKSKSEWSERVVAIERVTKVVKGGKKMSFRAIIVVGNEQGKVGVGVGKAGDHGLEWKLLASCQYLEKLSLADCWGKMSDKIVQSIVKNGKSLRVLGLQNFDLSALSFTVCNFFILFFLMRLEVTVILN